MFNNDILRRVRFALNINDDTMIKIFKLGECSISKEHLLGILAKEEDENFVKCKNNELNAFLDGFIIYKRGKQEENENNYVLKMTRNNINNIVLKKLRRALQLKSDDMLHIFSLAGLELSSSELSALFRKEDHRNYRECGDKYLRNFLRGLTTYYRNI